MQIVDSDDDKQVENRILLLFQHLNNAVIQEDLRSHKWKQAWDILTLSPDSFSVHMDTKASSQAAADPTWLTNGHHSYDVTAALSPGVKSCHKCIFFTWFIWFFDAELWTESFKILVGWSKRSTSLTKEEMTACVIHLRRGNVKWSSCCSGDDDQTPGSAMCVRCPSSKKQHVCDMCVLSAPSISFRSTHLRVTW